MKFLVLGKVSENFACKSGKGICALSLWCYFIKFKVHKDGTTGKSLVCRICCHEDDSFVHMGLVLGLDHLIVYVNILVCTA